MKYVKKGLKWIFYLIGAFFLYVVGCIAHGTWTDVQPEEKIDVKLENTSGAKKTVEKAELSFLNWNIGFGGQGKESTFFYDAGGFFFSNGKMVIAPKENVDKNLASIRTFLTDNPVDFYLLQEVDFESKRSYYINQYQEFKQLLKGYSATFTANYDVKRVPLPVCEFWNVLGKMHSGLGTFAKYQSIEQTRYQFPGKHGWPTRIFQLDRCMAVHRYPTNHPDGKELVVINSHNEAYDGGEIKAQEMAYVKEYITNEYEKGNYVIVGADWNQCPPGFEYDKLANERGIASDTTYNPGTIASDYLPNDWTWAYDPTVVTNRKLVDPYDEKTTFVTLIDYYLLSPNVELVEVKGVDLKFEVSDHQPVLMTVRLKDFGGEVVMPLDSTLVQ